MVRKVWDDENDADGIRPKNVTINLYADGVRIGSRILSAADASDESGADVWIYTFEDLDLLNEMNLDSDTLDKFYEQVEQAGIDMILSVTSLRWTMTCSRSRTTCPAFWKSRRKKSPIPTH